MLTKIKPIIRKEVEDDRLVDVVDVEAIEAIEASDQQEAAEAVPAHQMAVIVRAFPDLATAKANDGKIVEEDIDITAFIADRDLAQAEAEAQAEIDADQDAVDKELSKAVYGITTLLKKYIPALTTAESDAIDVFRTKYEKWIG